MKVAIISAGVVTNVVEASAEWVAENGGIEIPEDSSVSIGWTYDGLAFAAPAAVLTTFEYLKSAKSKEIVDCCDAACITGFTSDALGTPHLYPSKMLDQHNLNAQVTDSLLTHPVDWTTQQICQDVATGVWAYRPHTAAQIQQAGSAVKDAILNHRLHNAALQAQIAAINPASTSQSDIDAAMAALNAVVWA